MIRKPAVSGAFYPASKTELTEAIDGFLSYATPPAVPGRILGLMVPHAGYFYSGQVAAYGYKLLENQDIDTVILLGNSHTEYGDGISIFPEGAFETPLGKVDIDAELARRLMAEDSSIKAHTSPHMRDHILEVQLPFLQTVLKKKFKIVPMVFGNDSDALSRSLARAIQKTLGPKTLIIASTDMSHYPEALDADHADHKTITGILSGKAETLDKTIAKLEKERIPNAETFLCGISAVKTLLYLSEATGPYGITLLKYANSGDVSEDRTRVVGYSAIAFSEKSSGVQKTDDKLLSASDEKELLGIARRAVETWVKKGEKLKIKNSNPALDQPLGAFVTLKKHENLRGCIGRFEPNIPLYEVVIDMGIAAAAEDPRFAAVTTEELGEIEIEISVLSPLRRVKSADEIEIGKHGVEVVRGFRRGVFLPQVATENNLDKKSFLSLLCAEKAGLPADAWKDPKTELYVFTAQVFSESR